MVIKPVPSQPESDWVAEAGPRILPALPERNLVRCTS